MGIDFFRFFPIFFQIFFRKEILCSQKSSHAGEIKVAAWILCRRKRRPNGLFEGWQLPSHSLFLLVDVADVSVTGDQVDSSVSDALTFQFGGFHILTITFHRDESCPPRGNTKREIMHFPLSKLLILPWLSYTNISIFPKKSHRRNDSKRNPPIDWLIQREMGMWHVCGLEMMTSKHQY